MRDIRARSDDVPGRRRARLNDNSLRRDVAASATCRSCGPNWTRTTPGALLALAVLPFAGVFWWGFALPFGPVAAVPEVVLIVLNWRSLR
jgi:hypothetical protein